MIRPVRLLFGHQDAKDLVCHPVHALYFPISFRVIGAGHCKRSSKSLSYEFPESRVEPDVAVRANDTRDAPMRVYVADENISALFGCKTIFSAWYHDHFAGQRVQEVEQEVDRALVPLAHHKWTLEVNCNFLIRLAWDRH